MRTLASFLIAGTVTFAASSALAQGSMEKNGMSDSMGKEPAMSHEAKPTKMKKDRKGKAHDTMSKDSMGKDSMSKEPMKQEPMGRKPTSM
jgi:pentapeptide MXKDX repeat protein